VFFKRNRADLHIHTVGSGHAYSTIQEVLEQAKKKGLKVIAITDHGPKMPDGAHPYYFWNQKILPEKIAGIRVLKGIEANIITSDGLLDLEPAMSKYLDLVIASCHTHVSPEDQSCDMNTKMYLKALDHPQVNILGHIENPPFPCQLEEIVAVAKEKNKLIEINNASFTVARQGALENCLKVLQAVKDTGADTIINSDAHISYLVGSYETAFKAAKKIGIKESQILNFNLQKLSKYVPALA